MNNIKKILIVVQRSNGDVFLSAPLIERLHNHYENCQIDLLVNEDTLGIAKTLSNVHTIHVYSKKRKKENKFKQEFELFKTIYKKYDLSINLIAKDRSMMYAILSGKFSISAIKGKDKKSFLRDLFLNKKYIFDYNEHVVTNNCKPLKLLNIDNSNISLNMSLDEQLLENVRNNLKEKNIEQFFIFHTSAQYDYKIYPTHLRNKLIQLCSQNSIPLIITGGNTDLDKKISEEIPNLPYVYNLIGKTSLKELYCYIHLSNGYIGMDTLVMHMAAALNKNVYAIFGPSIPTMWGPWKNTEEQIIKVIQSDMDCVPCGKAGCDDKHGKSECLYNIKPETIYNEIQKLLSNRKEKVF